MKTVLETLQSGAQYFEKHGIESPRLNMEHLLAHVLECGRLQLYLDFDRPLEESQLAPLRELVKRRAVGVPLQHLLGTVEVCGLEFRCDGRALVPRPETELLIDKILRRTPADDAVVLDMGAGSGVIGLTLAAGLAEARVTLVDRSSEALDLARENAVHLGVSLDRLHFVVSDLFQNVDGTFDIVAANLPYLSREEIENASCEVKHDPVAALDGGVSGLGILERFIADSPSHVAAGGLLAMEVGADQAPVLKEAVKAAGYQDTQIEEDYAGFQRFLFARKT